MLGFFGTLLGLAGLGFVKAESGARNKREAAAAEEYRRLLEAMDERYCVSKEEWRNVQRYVFAHAQDFASGTMKNDIEYVFGREYVLAALEPRKNEDLTVDAVFDKLLLPPRRYEDSITADKPPSYSVHNALAILYLAKERKKLMPNGYCGFELGRYPSQLPYSFRLCRLVNDYIGNPTFEYTLVPLIIGGSVRFDEARVAKPAFSNAYSKYDESHLSYWVAGAPI